MKIKLYDCFAAFGIAVIVVGIVHTVPAPEFNLQAPDLSPISRAWDSFSSMPFFDQFKPRN